MGNRCKQCTGCSGVCRCLRAERGECSWWFSVPDSAHWGRTGCLPAGRECGSSAWGSALKGKCCPQQRLDKFNSFSDSDGLIKEWRIQPALSRWWPGTGRAPLPSPGIMLQTFHLSVKEAEAVGQGFPSTALLQPPLTFQEALSTPPLWCLPAGEAMRWGS